MRERAANDGHGDVFFLTPVLPEPVPITPALARRIEIWPAGRLVPYVRNPRTHSPEQVAQIAASIAEFGFNAPILVDSRAGIVADHGRLLAARKLGLPEVPVVVLDHLTDTQRRAYIIADNRLTENAGWDEKILAAELANLEQEGLDLRLVGFSDDELEALLANDSDDPLSEEEPILEPPGQPGDVWLIGNHRLICGDCAGDEMRRAVYIHAPPAPASLRGTFSGSVRTRLIGILSKGLAPRPKPDRSRFFGDRR